MMSNYSIQLIGQSISTFLDTPWSNFLRVAHKCTIGSTHKQHAVQELEKLWSPAHNRNPVFVGLSVRTIFDLYLSIMRFPPGSEFILSAVNIPDMIQIIHHHNLKVVPLDINIHNSAPKIEQMESLITDRTVGVIVTHIFGKWFDVTPFIEIAKQHNIQFIEDIAEGFCGFDHVGHQDSDLSLFSFGSIKYSTAFGGSIGKVKDKILFNKMQELYSTYPKQSHSAYLSKVMYCFVAYLLLNCPKLMKPGMFALRTIGVDYKMHVVNLLRGFPSQLIQKIRYQPCDALIEMLYYR